ncbi:protein of unknown function [Collimonas sp. OK242]|uniref:DUF4145 domain-containing protein n=1 Tax=Collimonas sp. OK242 TaxID=1798195 RepID=UPI000895D858|nr:DUF4145 domain-containing protein [Collimonas sp. OK242]SDY67635.1 protein of unknown function [Collimonas sp. OK242]
MQCPHCQIEIHPGFHTTTFNPAIGEKHGAPLYWTATHMECPSCHDAIIFLSSQLGNGIIGTPMRLVYPRAANRPKAPAEVPANLAEDFNEACLVLSDSPKASAALSRRCLQGVLHENGFTQHNLAPAIKAAIDSNKLPPAIADNLDAVRNIGNFAAHPMKDTSSGSIMSVEPEEAEWNLDVLEELFDFFYVQPEKAKQRRDALNAKLKAAGKPEMKQ